MSASDALDSAARAPVVIACTAAAGLALTLALALVALRAGWIDRSGGDPDLAARKPRRTPVPLVGGAAILGALALAAAAGWSDARALPWWSMLAAFAVGALDDVLPRGLDWRGKLAGQAIAAAILAARPGLAFEERALLVALGVVAQNAANTFDNADGALAGVGALALRGHPAVLGALLGFLPANLLVRRGAERAPLAYLGDAGSHVLGILWAATPAAWPALALPLGDLARLVLVRRRAGRAPWRGDRRHLAHRLAAAGLPPLAVVLVLCAVAAPSAWAGASGARATGGVVATLVLLAAALRLAPERVSGAAEPCREPPPGR